MTDYIMQANNVLGDNHSFVRLVDTMPGIRSGLPPSRPGKTHGWHPTIALPLDVLERVG